MKASRAAAMQAKAAEETKIAVARIEQQLQAVPVPALADLVMVEPPATAAHVEIIGAQLSRIEQLLPVEVPATAAHVETIGAQLDRIEQKLDAIFRKLDQPSNGRK